MRSMNTSLQTRLSALISLAVIAIAGSAAAFTFFASWDDAHTAQDKQLRQTAHLIGRLQTGPVTFASRQKIKGISLEERLVVRFLPAPGTGEPDPADGFTTFPGQLADGLQTVTIDGDSWRVFVRTDGQGVRVAVAQQTEVRNALAVKSALRALLPFGVLVLVLLVLVRLLIRQLFEPLRVLAAEAGRRASDDLRPLDAVGLPDEAQPLVAEFNRLLKRVDAVMQAQRRFVADAAHEMRSPLTALSLQTERLAAADMPAEARRRMQDLAQGLTRTRALLDQLLALARSQQSAQNAPSAVSLQRVLRDVIEDLYPLAEERAIDLGVLSADDAMIHAQPLDLHLLVKNLIDNAIRYTPRHGRVDVSLAARDGGVDFIVDDTGPGIAEAERERVFGAFYRGAGDIGVPGSGLGLAIVKAVADKMGATVTLAAPSATGAGLRVVVGFVTGR